MIGPNRGLTEPKWVSRFVDLMRETEALDGRVYLLAILISTPQSKETVLTRFVQLNGIEMLKDWIDTHKKEQDKENMDVLS
jgi:hypothetical protein